MMIRINYGFDLIIINFVWPTRSWFFCVQAVSTMANLKRRGPIRQFSLQCDSPKASEKTKTLIKQSSEDFGDANYKPDHELGIRVSLCSKNSRKNNEQPLPIKIAWEDKKSPREDCTVAKTDAIIVKKCTDVKKPNSPRRILRQNSLERDSILYTRQGFAKRLEQAWKDREANGKTNLNIILTHTTTEPKHEDVLADVSNTEKYERVDNAQKPKIILPLKPDLVGASGDGSNMKNVFQKHIRRTVKQKSLFDDGYSPTKTADKPTTIVVPLMDSKAIIAANQKNYSPSNKAANNRILVRENSVESRNQIEEKQNSHASTAASRREMFQKRTNSAFHGSTVKRDSSLVRPPLLRTSSVPAKQDSPKPKFVATKRRVKTAKAKIKYDKESDDEQLSSGRRSALQRCVSVAGVLDVVTMVSLVSTSGSENEDDDGDYEEDREKISKDNDGISNKTVTVQKLENGNCEEDEKGFSLRKTVKSVSFQQSSIHAVRSFSASFPGRRCSMATSLFLNSATYNQPSNNGVQKIQEKRAPLNVLEDEESVPKRRLVRTKSAPMDKSMENSEAVIEDLGNDNEINVGDVIDAKQSKNNAIRMNPSSEMDDDRNGKGSSDPAADKFDNPKERQCWEMYRRMNEKGVAISFDTILRGMLTPTEYRLRRKLSLLPNGNDGEVLEN
ncbi:hypothetical protein Trydic_g15091 [Trypoxylus dichotomus]